MMKKTFNIIIIFSFFILNFFSSGFSQDETITVTTYYPAPYGVYSLLKLEPGAQPPGACRPGEMYFSLANNIIELCTDTGWHPLGLFSDIQAPTEYWSGGGNIFYMGRVGIGPITLALTQAELTVGQLYTYIRAGAPVAGTSTPSCPCDSNPAGAPECGPSFPSMNDLGLTCVDLFNNAGTPSYYLYNRQPFAGGNSLRVRGRSSFDTSRVGISIPIGTPLLYNLEVGGSLQADNYRGRTSLGITRTSAIPAGQITIREADNTADCHITVKNGLITASDCGHGCGGQPAVFCYLDQDGDGYGAGSGQWYCNSCPANHVLIAGDCCDTDNRVFPGQTNTFPWISNCATWDYNCNGVIEKFSHNGLSYVRSCTSCGIGSCSLGAPGACTVDIDRCNCSATVDTNITGYNCGALTTEIWCCGHPYLADCSGCDAGVCEYADPFATFGPCNANGQCSCNSQTMTYPVYCR